MNSTANNENLYIARDTQARDHLLLMAGYTLRARVIVFADAVSVQPVNGALTDAETRLLNEFCDEIENHSEAMVFANSWSLADRQVFRNLAAASSDVKHETLAVAKSAKLAAFIELNIAAGILTLSDLAILRDEQWQILSSGAGVRMPRSPGQW